MSDPPEPRIEFVSQYELNAAFDSMVAHYRERGIAPAIKVIYDKPASPTNFQPPGTRSIVEKLNDPESGQLVAVVHYYLLADSVTIGASGKKDPKRVIWDGVDYQVRKQPLGLDG